KVSSATDAALVALLEALIPLGCRAAAEQDALIRLADRDRCAPEDFYSTTNQRTEVRVGDQWIAVEQQRMDAAVVVDGGHARCRKLRDIRSGDRIVCGLAGIRVTPEFRDRNRAHFTFMTNDVSSERRVGASGARISAMMRETKAAGRRIAFVAGPVVVHTGGAVHFA